MNRAYSDFVRRFNQLGSSLEKGDFVLRARESTIAMPETVAFLMDKFEMEDPAVRLAIAHAISRVHGDGSPSGMYETLIRAVKLPAEVQDTYNQLVYKASDAVVDAAMGLCFFRQRRDETVRELTPELDRHSRWIGTNLAHALLYARFELDPPRQLSCADLSNEQSEVLEIILSSRRPWVLNGNMAESLARFGLPTTKDDMRTFLSK